MTSHFNGWGTHQSECHFWILMDFFLTFFSIFFRFFHLQLSTSTEWQSNCWEAVAQHQLVLSFFVALFCCDCLHPSTSLCPALEFGANWSSQLSINHEIYSGHQTYHQATAAATTTTANCPLIGCWYRLTVFVFEICPLVAWQWYFGWTLWMDAQCLLLLPPNHWEHQHQQQPLQPVAREWQCYNEVFVFGVV